jgi:hypothetical protein
MRPRRNKGSLRKWNTSGGKTEDQLKNKKAKSRKREKDVKKSKRFNRKR